MAGYVMRQFTCPKAVTHPSTNRARCRATALIETNALTGLLVILPKPTDFGFKRSRVRVRFRDSVRESQRGSASHQSALSFKSATIMGNDTESGLVE